MGKVLTTLHPLKNFQKHRPICVFAITWQTIKIHSTKRHVQAVWLVFGIFIQAHLKDSIAFYHRKFGISEYSDR